MTAHIRLAASEGEVRPGLDGEAIGLDEAPVGLPEEAGADTGPLHLASALGAPCVGLFGPTDPARNGPFWSADVRVRNPQNCETTYRRGKDFAASMLSITVDQAFRAIDARLAR